MTEYFNSKKQIELIELIKIAKKVEAFDIEPCKQEYDWTISLSSPFNDDEQNNKTTFLQVCTNPEGTKVVSFIRNGFFKVENILQIIEWFCDVKIWSEHTENYVKSIEGQRQMIVVYRSDEEKKDGTDFCKRFNYAPLYYDASEYLNSDDKRLSQSALFDECDLDDFSYSFNMWFANTVDVGEKEDLQKTSEDHGNYQLYFGMNPFPIGSEDHQLLM